MTISNHGFNIWEDILKIFKEKRQGEYWVPGEVRSINLSSTSDIPIYNLVF